MYYAEQISIKNCNKSYATKDTLYFEESGHLSRIDLTDPKYPYTMLITLGIAGLTATDEAAYVCTVGNVSKISPHGDVMGSFANINYNSASTLGNSLYCNIGDASILCYDLNNLSMGSASSLVTGAFKCTYVNEEGLYGITSSDFYKFNLAGGMLYKIPITAEPQTCASMVVLGSMAFYTSISHEVYSIDLNTKQVGYSSISANCNSVATDGKHLYVGQSDGIFKIHTSKPPVISGRDEDFGERTQCPCIQFTVTNDDFTTVFIELDGEQVNAGSTQGDYNGDTDFLKTTQLSNGKHTITIIATDTDGQKAVRIYTFTKIHQNSNPVISDSDRSLGDKNLHFSVIYQVSDSDAGDSLTVTEKLNDTVLRTLSNAPRNTDLIIHVTNEMLYKLPLNSENKITIQIDDGEGGTSYRNFTFRRTNTAPVIDGADKDLGVVTRDVSEKYSTFDQEGNPIIVTEEVDGVILKTFTAEAKKEYTTSIPLTTWLGLTNGKHTLTVQATDSNNATSIRTFTFEKKENKIILDLKKPFTTDAKANKILITPVWGGVENATIKVETCNNALDTTPTWEDCTKEVLLNQKYTFTNKEKTGEKWGINLRFTLERKPNTTGEIFITGFGGAFE